MTYTLELHSYFEKKDYFLTFERYQTALNAYNTLNAQEETKYPIHLYLEIGKLTKDAPKDTQCLFDTTEVYYLVSDYIS